VAEQLTISAFARTGDPSTSHAAAASLTADVLRRSQADVLAVLREIGPSTDTELVDAYIARALAEKVSGQSESGVRTRRKELVRAQEVVDTGRRERLPSGRNSIIWSAVR
jgi:hypothetical protein